MRKEYTVIVPLQYDGVSKSFQTKSIMKYKLTAIKIVEKQNKGLWRQNSLD
jgi:hypothetical protein